GKPVIAVDNHVAVISRRWHLTKEKDPEKIREDIHKKIPKNLWGISNQLLVEFGKEFCRSRFPKCKICPVQKLCPYEFKNL
ncbi:MAG: endonuclease III, partial [Candidatus Aenigmatarchaeota archaeon]